jgi:hypothetical protein
MKKPALKDGLYHAWFKLVEPLVLKYLTAIWWIEYADLDGFRVDTTTIQTRIAKWTKITDEYPTFNIVGEVWMQNTSQMAYWQKTVQ